MATQADEPASVEPRADRPRMPGYNLAGTGEGRGLLPWAWAVERLAAARNYWLATARPGGPPHLMPVWGVWLDGRFAFSTGARSRKARNLAADGRCTIATERADEAVIVEGTASLVGDPDLHRAIVAAYEAKYGWALDGSEGPLFAIQPRVVFGLIEHADQFAGTATRWRFPEGRAAHQGGRRLGVGARPWDGRG